MGLIFEVKQRKGGNLTATCHSENIFTEGVDLKELHSKINTEVDRRFEGRDRPVARDIHLLMSRD